jgi:hypothetical protein
MFHPLIATVEKSGEAASPGTNLTGPAHHKRCQRNLARVGPPHRMQSGSRYCALRPPRPKSPGNNSVWFCTFVTLDS